MTVVIKRKRLKNMAIRKNKKRFDPRYFMDEKMEEPTLKEGRELYAPQYDPHEQKRWEEEQERKEKKDKKKDVPRGSEEINYSLEEGLENVTPENLAIVAQAAAIVAGNFAPAVIIGAIGMKLKDAIDYLRANSSQEEAPSEELNELNEPMVFLDQLQGALAASGYYSEQELEKKIHAMAELVSPDVVAAMDAIKRNSVTIGDLHTKLGGTILRDENIEKLEPGTANLFTILKVLGKYRTEWDV
tara:strand:+ start:2089 stop:2820 length:732 start_codon:yes stop_codon:yes gene_type:complete